MGLDRIARAPVQHQRPGGVQRQLVAEGGRLHRKVQLVEPGARRPAHPPMVDPGGEGIAAHPGLADAAARQPFGGVMGGFAGQPGMAHPDLRAAPSRGLARGQGAAKQRELDPEFGPVGGGQIGGQIPPFDAEIGMRAMVAREGQRPVGAGQGKAFGGAPQPAIALGPGQRRRRPGQQRRGQGGADQPAAPNGHRQRPSASPPAGNGRAAAPAAPPPARPPPAPATPAAASRRGKDASAAASRKPRR